MNFQKTFRFLEKIRILGEIQFLEKKIRLKKSDFCVDFSVKFVGSNHCIVAWVKRAEQPKGTEDEVKQAN